MLFYKVIFLSICLLSTFVLSFIPLINKNNFQNQQCSGHGYIYNDKCFCQSQWIGENCQNKGIHYFFDVNYKCDDIQDRIDHLFNISPNNYDHDDDQFSRKSNKMLKTFDHIHSGMIALKWIKMHSLTKSFNIFGSKISAKDIRQGFLGNCYILAAMASLASIRDGELIRNMFMTKQDNKNHVYVTRWFIGGRPVMVAVDDYVPGLRIPFFKVSSFSKLEKTSKNFWPLILEKAWAKIHGSYLKIEAGLASMGFLYMTGAPISFQDHENINSDKLFLLLKNIQENEWPMSASSHSDSKMVTDHAFSLLGVQEIDLEDQENSEKQKLIKVFNPWGSDINQNKWNSWSEHGKSWTPFRKNQVNFDQKYNGVSFLTHDDFKKQFEFSSWAEVYQDYEIFDLEVPFKKIGQVERSTQKFQVIENFAEEKPIFISIYKMDERLLPKKCNQPEKYIKIDVYDDNNNRAKYKGQAITDLIQTVEISKAQSQIYSVYTHAYRLENWLKYYVLTVYAPKKSIKWLEAEQYQNELKKCPDDCKGNGKCNGSTGMCICYNEWKGINCSIERKCKQNKKCK